VTRPTLADAVGLGVDRLTAVVRRLVEAGQTIAVAESLTAGLITATLTTVPGASAVVRGGLVVYATDLKHAIAGVDADLLARVGAVHPEVARQLAGGVRTVCDAAWGVGVTGVAGPDPQDGQPVGTVFTCLDTGSGTLDSADLFTGDREAIRAATVRRVVQLIEQALDR
jgi:nicotinamide-nucleotide amidase